MDINIQPLSYENLLTDRPLEQIELVVIHCTELPDLKTAREYGEKVLYDSGTGNSGHYYIDLDGAVHQWVKPAKIAHHVKGHNQQSIGIELVNRGRYPNWFDSRSQQPSEAYPAVQINSLIQLLNVLSQQLPELKHIAGHDDLDQNLVTASDNPNLTIRRKVDPGPLFPWDQVMQGINLINIGSHAKNYE